MNYLSINRYKRCLKNLFLFLILFYLIQESAVSQPVAEDDDLCGYIEKYKDYPYIILDAFIDIEIMPDEFSNAPSITKTERIVYLSLEDQVVINSMNYHSNNSTIEKVGGSIFSITTGDKPLNNVFHDDMKFSLFSKDVQYRGSKIRLETVEKFKDFRFFPAQYFFRNIPIVHEEIKIRVDSTIKYKVFTYNFDSTKITTNYSRHGRYYTQSYVSDNILPVENEKWSSPLSCNMPHIVMNIRSFESVYGKRIKALESINDLYTMYKNLISETQNDTIALRPILDSIISKEDDAEQRIRLIYNWVQKKIRYIAFEYELEGYIPANAIDVVNNRYGDCKGVANLLKTFLTMEGYDARICWMNTKQSPYNYLIPSFNNDNHMICAILNDEQPSFLDATNKNLGLYDLAEYMQGKKVMIENGATPWLYQIPILNVKSNASIYNYSLSVNNKVLSGKLNVKFNGNKRGDLLQLQDDLNQQNNQIVKGILFNGSSQIDLNLDNDQINVIGDSSVQLQSAIQIFGNVHSSGNFMFVRMFPMKEFQVETMDTSRTLDVEFAIRNYSEQIVQLKIPTGYTLKSLPVDTSFLSPVGSIKYSYIVIDSTITCRRIYINDKSILPIEKLTDWNEFIHKVSIEDNKRVVLQKTIN